MPDDHTPITEFAYPDAKRKNLPPAGSPPGERVKEEAKVKFAYDPHRSPVLRFNEGITRCRELLEKATRTQITKDEAAELAAHLESEQPWLEWAGKREQPHFEVEPVALHLHERVSAQAILRAVRREDAQRDFFAEPRLPAREARAYYQHDVDWANRLILGDSLQVMTSLARREGLAGQVQMIYLDPPYGIKFSSNWQNEVGKRDVKDKDEDLTREPEMIRAYRDTWTLGVHSYLAYLKQRLLLARELLTDSGSIFVQISDENLHRVRAVMDEVLGPENYVRQILIKKTTGSTADFIPSTGDFLLWYSKDISRLKFRATFDMKRPGEAGATGYTKIEVPSGERRPIPESLDGLADDVDVFAGDNITSQSLGREKGEGAASWFRIAVDGFDFDPGPKARWKTNEEGMGRLFRAERLIGGDRTTLSYKRKLADFPVTPISDLWTDTVGQNQLGGEKLYVVQTANKIVQRCLLMTTEPGDLVLDPTCGSGTTAFVAEQWGRRWITVDSSRVAAAIARQRLLTASYETYRVKRPQGEQRTSPGVTGTSPGVTGTSPGVTGTSPGVTGTSPGVTGTSPGALGTLPGVSGTSPGVSGTSPGVSGASPGVSGSLPGASGSSPGASGSSPGASGSSLGALGSARGEGGLFEDRSGWDPNAPLNPKHGFIYKSVPHITLKSIAQNKGLDPIFARHEPILAARLAALNAALAGVTDPLRQQLVGKLIKKLRDEGARTVTDADQRRWLLPGTNPQLIPIQKGGPTATQARDLRAAIPPEAHWREWEVPFDHDPDWPAPLREALTAYRTAWRAKMDEVNAAISANAEQEELVDQPELVRGVVRVSGPFTVESIRPPENGPEPETPIGGAPEELDTFDVEAKALASGNASSHIDRMLDLLSHDGITFLGNKHVKVEPLQRIESSFLHAEGEFVSADDGKPHRVAVVIGPELGSVPGFLVEQAMRHCYKRGYDDLVVAGFGFDAMAQEAIQDNNDDKTSELRIHMAQIRPDVAMGDLLKKPTVSAQIFTVFGQPRTRLTETDGGEFVLHMEGVDIYDPVKNCIEATNAGKVAAWFVDTDYDGRVFCICQAFFPDKSAWEKLARALKGSIEEGAFQKLSGTTSLPFKPGERQTVAVKVIDPRGNEVMRVHRLGAVVYGGDV